jgi:hypothetical protein
LRAPLSALVSLTRLQVSKYPSCFSKAALLLRCFASLDRVRLRGVPRCHQYYQSTKTSCAEYGITYLFALPLQLASPRSLPGGGDLRPGQVPLKPQHHRLFQVGHTQDLPGSWGIHPIPLPRSRTSAGPTDFAFTVSRYRSRFWDNENPSIAAISRLNHAASVSAAYASRACHHALCKARFRWMANPCRVGVEPTGFQ